MGLPYCSFGILIHDFMEFLDILKHKKTMAKGFKHLSLLTDSPPVTLKACRTPPSILIYSAAPFPLKCLKGLVNVNTFCQRKTGEI